MIYYKRRCALLAVLILCGAFSVAHAANVLKLSDVIWSGPAVSLDPADRLDDNSVTPGDPAIILGEWNTPGNMDGWTDSGLSGISVSNGVLSGTGTVDAPYIQLSGISPEPDLDFAFFDYLQFRLKLPAGFNEDFEIYFGTSTQSGINTSSDRKIVIPAAELPSDGAWHTYRLDLGLVVWWRDQLSDLRVYPLGNSGNGKSFELDYIEVGDVPGDVLLPNTNLNIHGNETFADCIPLHSKHAVCWYSPESYNRYSSWDPQVHGRRALRMIEESLQVYTKMLGYNEPFESYDIGRRDGNRYKINHVTWYDGFWCGGFEGFMHVGINGWGLLDEGWGNPMPHEFGHAVQGHQPSFLAGGHWESHVNYMRNARNMHFKDIFASGMGGAEDKILVYSNFRQDHGYFLYADYRIHQALEDYAGDLGYPSISSDVWKNGAKDQTVYKKIEDELSPSDDLGDVVAYGLRHWPFLDMDDADDYKSQLWANKTYTERDEKSLLQYRTGSHLIPCQDKPGWYRSPFERSPERFAYMVHELDPSATDVTVELQGFDMLGTTEDWRWSFAATDDDWENLRYSAVYSPADGPQTFSMQTGDTKLFLVVVATPTDSSLNLEWTDNKNPIDKHADRLHYAYEVSLTGATPAIAARQLNEPAGSGAPHANGGGWVDSSAYAASTAYVGPNAKVLGSAQVLGNARIEDYAVVMDTSIVRDNAVVSGHAMVERGAVVEQDARVRDRGRVDRATVTGRALIEDYAEVWENATVQDHAIARGCSRVFNGSGKYLGGHAIAGYDSLSDQIFTNGVTFAHIPWGGWYQQYWWDTLAKPEGLVASYRVEAADGQICWDEFGAQHALMRGGVQRVYDPQVNSQVLELNGTDQYLVLDRSVCDLIDGSVSIRINPDDNIDRPLLYLGRSASAYLELALNASGQAVCTITDGASSAVVTSTASIPTGNWSSVSAMLDGTSLTLYVDGVQADQTACLLVPVDVLGAGDYSQAEAFYVGRDWSGNLFDGRMDDIRFYNIAMTAAQVANEILRGGDCIGALLFDGEMDFNGTSTKLESGVRNGLERRIEASIYPHTSDDVTYYEAIFDSNDERDGSVSGSGIGLDNGKFVIRLDNHGFWNTGVSVALNQWQHVALEFDGTTAKFYVNDVLQGTQVYSATEANIASKNYRIGAGQSAVDTYHYFDGLIKEVKIYDRIPFELDTIPPAAPTGLTSMDGSGFVMLDWNDNAESDLDGYNVYRSITSGSGYAAIATDISTSTYIDHSVVGGATYYYVVTAVDKSTNESGSSNETAGTPTAASTTGMVGVNIGPTAHSIASTETAGVIAKGYDHANWNNVLGTSSASASSLTDDSGAATTLSISWTGAADSFNATGSGDIILTGNFVQNGTFNLSNIPYENYDLVLYYNAFGDKHNDSQINLDYGSNSSVDRTVYISDKDSWLSDDGNDYVEFISDISPDGAPAGANFGVVVGLSARNMTIAIFDDVAPHNSLAGFQIIATSDATPPAAPTGLSAVPGSGSVSLDWADNMESDLLGYSIYRSTTSGSGYSAIATGVVASAYVDAAPVLGTTYYYVVTAIDNSSNESGYSHEEAGSSWTVAEQWRFDHFGSIANTGPAADGADPDGDGVINILERAHGGNPHEADVDILPQFDPDGPILSIVYRQAVEASDLGFEVEQCDNLMSNTWVEAVGTNTVLSNDGTILSNRFTSPVEADSMFLRVRVVAP